MYKTFVPMFEKFVRMFETFVPMFETFVPNQARNSSEPLPGSPKKTPRESLIGSLVPTLIHLSWCVVTEYHVHCTLCSESNAAWYTSHYNPFMASNGKAINVTRGCQVGSLTLPHAISWRSRVPLEKPQTPKEVDKSLPGPRKEQSWVSSRPETTQSAVLILSTLLYNK